jgi:hypothetical protein
MLILAAEHIPQPRLFHWNHNSMNIKKQQRQHENWADVTLESGHTEVNERQPNVHRIASEPVGTRRNQLSWVFEGYGGGTRNAEYPQACKCEQYAADGRYRSSDPAYEKGLRGVNRKREKDLQTDAD